MEQHLKLKNVVDNLKTNLRAKQGEVALFIGINATYLSDLINGNKEITPSFITKAKENAKINPDYLSGGLGDMYLEPIEKVLEQFRTFRDSLYKDVVVDLSESEPSYQAKYIALLEKREHEVSLDDIWQAVQANQQLLVSLHKNLVKDSKEGRTSGEAPGS